MSIRSARAVFFKRASIAVRNAIAAEYILEVAIMQLDA